MISAIKDAIDMILELEKRIKDNRIRAELMPIRMKILEAKEENIDLSYSYKNEVIGLKNAHMSEIERLKESYDNKLFNLHKIIDNLQNQITDQQKQIEELSKKPKPGPITMIRN